MLFLYIPFKAVAEYIHKLETICIERKICVGFFGIGPLINNGLSFPESRKPYLKMNMPHIGKNRGIDKISYAESVMYRRGIFNFQWLLLIMDDNPLFALISGKFSGKGINGPEPFAVIQSDTSRMGCVQGYYHNFCTTVYNNMGSLGIVPDI
jgi:hypothetical protein